MHRRVPPPKARWLLLAVAALAVIGLLVAAGCGGSLPAAGDVDNNVVESLADKGVRVIDVRTVSEFEAGHIPGAENVPLDQLPTAMGSWNPSKPVLVYCATGSRSAEALRMLTAAGFSAVYNLTDGIVAWDGEVTTDPAGQVATGGGATPSASGLPVMYEFYTDW